MFHIGTKKIVKIIFLGAVSLIHVLYNSSVFVAYFAEMVELKKNSDNFLGADGEHLRFLVSSASGLVGSLSQLFESA